MAKYPQILATASINEATANPSKTLENLNASGPLTNREISPQERSDT